MENTNEYLVALQELEKQLASFQVEKDDKDINLFTAVGMTTQEIKHSAFLAWLLHSEENHGLGSVIAERLCDKLYDYQLQQTGNYSIKSNEEIIKTSTRVADKPEFISLVKGLKCKVHTEVVTEEDKRIDILIDFPQTKTVIVIENKMFTKTHDDQLVNYQKYIENPISGYNSYRNKIYIYLAPQGEIPINVGGDEKYNETWCICDYKTIIIIIDELLKELGDKQQYSQIKGKKRTKLISLMEDYKAMIKTNILMENPNILEECKRILDDKKLREAFELLTLYTQTATEDKVLSFVRQYLGAVDDNAKSKRWFYTQPMQEFFEREGEKINNRLCRCVCQPIGAMGGIVGYDISISLEKINGSWTKAQEKILSKVLSNQNWKNKTFSGPANTRTVLLTGDDRGQLFEAIKPKLETQLQKFKVILNNFEKQITEIVL